MPRRVVIKIGSSLLTNADHSLNEKQIQAFAGDIAELHRAGFEVLIVTSGAAPAGRKELHLTSEDKTIPVIQSYAAVGQSLLMNQYHKALFPHGIIIAQALLTRHDFKDRTNYLTVREVFLNLLKHKVIPVVNENDVTSVRAFEGNDNLAALVAGMIDADRVIYLTDVDGLYTADPKEDPTAKRIPVVTKLDKKIISGARHVKSAISVGGMHSKILAAQDAMKAGVIAHIVDGHMPHVITRVLLAEEQLGTTCIPDTKVNNTRTQWLVANASKKHRIIVDDPAVKILKSKGPSLLAKGIVGVEGSFSRGDVVYICSRDGDCFACGQTAYGAADINKIKGLHSRDIAQTLGFHFGDEVIHRDNMATL